MSFIFTRAPALLSVLSLPVTILLPLLVRQSDSTDRTSGGAAFWGAKIQVRLHVNAAVHLADFRASSIHRRPSGSGRGRLGRADLPR